MENYYIKDIDTIPHLFENNNPCPIGKLYGNRINLKSECHDNENIFVYLRILNSIPEEISKEDFEKQSEGTRYIGIKCSKCNKLR